MEKYIFIKEIGSGSFGKVFLVKSKQKGINYVVKQVDLTKLDRKQSQSATKEVEVLAKLKHYNVVSYKESYEKNNQLNIVLEYCENGDLHDKIKEKKLSNKFFGENEILDYFVQICLALEYIHGKRILHRDLKTKNIFLTKGNVIKLGDFGIAKVLENSFELAQTCIGSPFYVSPEICESKPYNKKSDVWALGCVLYELATLKYAFVAKNVKTLLTKILTGVYNPLPTNMNIHIRGLISVMLKPNPKDRPSVRDILEKRFLLRRRATFICKAHQGGLDRRRSQSGDVLRSFPLVANNESKRSELKRGKLSLSCLQLNQLKDQRKFNSISNPETKYKPLNTNQVSKADKKVSDTKNEGNSVQNEKHEISEVKNVFTRTKSSLKSDYKNKNSSFEALKKLNLPKVDSEYYNMIAGYGEAKKGKQEAANQKPEPKVKKSQEIFLQVEEDIKGLKFSSPNDPSWEKIENEKNQTENEHRKRWVKNTLQKKELLAILSDSEILNGNLSLGEFPSGKPDPNTSIDDMLSLEPSEISEDVLLPIKLYANEISKNNPFQLLQQEVEYLREKFELNNRTYQIEDLLRLTDSSKKLINFESGGVNTENDRKMGQWVFYNLEYQKMTLERKVGFTLFLRAYGEMINIINEDFGSNNSPENRINGTETYVISKVGVSGDSDDVIKNTWKSIVNFLGDKWEYLPDIWELAMSEHIYYHL